MTLGVTTDVVNKAAHGFGSPKATDDHLTSVHKTPPTGQGTIWVSVHHL